MATKKAGVRSVVASQADMLTGDTSGLTSLEVQTGRLTPHRRRSAGVGRDLLGIKRGQYARKPAWTIGDATAERAAHATAAGHRIVLERE